MATLRRVKVLTGLFVLLSLLTRIRTTRQLGRRIGRATLATLTMATTFVVFQSPAEAAPAPIFNGTPPVVDGKLDPLYASGFSEISYTQTGASPKEINGQLSVIETPTAYYLGFQQGLNRKSNAYCEDTKTSPGCYQKFGSLVGSDHISFEWPSLDGEKWAIGVDIITANANAQYGYSGMVKSPLNNGGKGEGVSPLGCDNVAGLTGFSGMDYNWHHAGAAGWGADPASLLNSPNFAGKAAQYPDYVYASTAEVRIDKALCGLADGLDLFSGLLMEAHNSPSAPTEDNPAEFIVCAEGNPVTGTLGVPATLTLNVLKTDPLGNLVPNTGKTVLVFVASGPGTLTAVNGVNGATSGVSSSPGGTVTATVLSNTTGTTSLRAAIDLNGNGLWDQGTEPATEPNCPIDFTGTPPDVKISKSANVTSVTAPGSITYTITVNNDGGSPATNTVITDDLNNNLVVNSATFQVGGGGANGNCTFTAGNVMTCAVGTLAANDNAVGGADSVVVTVTVSAGPSACPEVINQAHVTATNEATAQQTDTQANPTGDNWSLPVNVEVVCEEPPPDIAVQLIKTNDANGDNDFNKAEVAPAEGATVPFHLEIRNTSDVAVQIDELTDTWPGHAIDDVCSDLLGQTLAPYVPANSGPVLTCDFEETGYAPPAGADPKVNTARVEVSNPDDASQTAEDTDTSSVTVNIVVPPVITVDIVKTNDANGDATYSDSEVAPVEGADVPFKAVVTNTSDVAVQILTLTDIWPGASLLNICTDQLIGTVLDPDESATCLWTVADYAPANSAGALINTAAVLVGQVGDLDNTAADQDTSAVTSPPPVVPDITVDLVKTNDADGDSTYNDSEISPSVGADVPFRAVITNTSDVAVQILTLTDEFPAHAAAGICGDLIGTVLDPDESATCEWTEPGYSQAPNLGAKINTARVTVGEEGNLDNTANANDTSAVTTLPVPPPVISVHIVKTNDANGDGTYHDSEVAPEEGADVPFRAVITNTSAVAITIESLTDLLPDAVDADDICADLIGTVLDPDGFVTCDWTEAGYAGAPDDPAKVNTATVEGCAVTHPEICDTDDDTSTVTSPPPPPPPDITVNLVKTNDADGDGGYHDAEVAPEEGADVPFRAVITNTSDVAVEITSLTDLLPGNTIPDDICAELIGTVLDPGDFVTCEWTEADYAPAPGGSKVNTASVTVCAITHPDSCDSDDDKSTVIVNPVVPPDITVEIVKTNDADGDGTYNDAEEAPEEGADVPFRAVITNTSDVAITIESLTDLLPGNVTADNICADLVGTVLNSGASVTCDWTEAGYAGAPNAPAKVNTASVEGCEVLNPENCDSDDDTSSVTTPTPPPPPVITVNIVKTNDANGDGTYNDAEVAPTEGADVPFRAVITNTSDVAVTIESLTDLLPGAVDADDICADLVGTVLDPDESVTCNWTEAGYAGAPDAPAKVNTASVEGCAVTHPEICATDDDTSSVTTSELPPPPDITVNIVKTNDANGDGDYNDSEVAPVEGADVPFRAVITNTSDVAVTIESLTDLLPGSDTADAVCADLIGTVLDPDESVTCNWIEEDYAGAPDDAAKVNTATVEVCEDENGDNCATDDDTSSVTTETPPVISIVVDKTNDGNGDGTFTKEETGTVGNAVEFRVTVTNTSAVNVVIASISDVWPDVVAFQPACEAQFIGLTLTPGQSATCEFTVTNYVPTAAQGAKVNTATVGVCEDQDVNNCTSAQSTSTVRGLEVLPFVTTPTPQPQTLPRTGAPNTGGLVAAGFGLLALGAFLILVSGGSSRAALVSGLSSSTAAVPYPCRPVIDRNLARGDAGARRASGAWSATTARRWGKFTGR